MMGLFADGFNVQQMLATGVIGAGIAGMVGTGQWIKRQMEERKAAAKESGQPAKMNDLYVKMVLVMAVGMVVIFAGIAWRANSKN